MSENHNEWIDPAIARRLMLEYRQAIGVKGGSEIERQIDAHTKQGLHRKTIENWLNDPKSIPSPQTLKIVLRFIQTKHFQSVIPRTRDYLESDSRLYRIGTALFDLYGANIMDAVELKEINAITAGWWIKCVNRQDLRPGYLYIATVTDHPFSKIHVIMGNDDVPKGSGIIFPAGMGPTDFAARIWSKEVWRREKSLQMVLTSLSGSIRPLPRWRDAILVVMFYPRSETIQAGAFAGKRVNGTGIRFERADEHTIPIEIQNMFDEWDRDVLPQSNIGQGFLSLEF